MLITKSHQANEPVQVSIDKEELKLIPAIANHPVLFNEPDWYMTSVIYKHVTNSERLAAGFKSNFTETVDVPLKSGMVGGDVYELHEILVSGANRSPIVSIKRADIPNASTMDLILASAFPMNVVWNSTYGAGNDISQYIVLPNGKIYGGQFPSDQFWALSTDCPAANEDGEYTFIVNGVNIGNGYMFGIKGTYVTPPPFNQSGVGFTGLSVVYVGGYPTIRTAYNNGSTGQVGFDVWNTEGNNTVVIKRTTTGPNSSQITIKVNGTEVLNQVDIYREYPFQPAVSTRISGENLGIISAQRTA